MISASLPRPDMSAQAGALRSPLPRRCADWLSAIAYLPRALPRYMPAPRRMISAYAISLQASRTRADGLRK